MDDEIKVHIDEKKIIYIVLASLIFFLFLIGKGIYDQGAINMCKETGGELIINEQKQKRCVNITSLDLCISEEKRIIEKPQNQYNLPDIIIGDE